MSVLTALFPGAFCGQGSSVNVISDDSAAERMDFKECGLLHIFVHYRACGDGY